MQPQNTNYYAIKFFFILPLSIKPICFTNLAAIYFFNQVNCNIIQYEHL